MSNILELEGIKKSFRQGGETLEVLNGASLTMKKGEVVAIVGPSGCGKSTLLQIAGLLDTPDNGSVLIDGRDMGKLSDRKRTKARRNHLGFVYQYHHLMREFSAQENVVLPQLIQGKRRSHAKARAKELLERLGLGERLTHRPAELSGGEQQRTAIARAIAGEPAILLADEPTGNLDPHTADGVFDMLLEQVESMQLTFLFVTHNATLAAKANRVVKFDEGELIEG